MSRLRGGNVVNTITQKLYVNEKIDALSIINGCKKKVETSTNRNVQGLS